MARTEQLLDRLRRLQATYPEITASAIVSPDGMSIASTVAGESAEDRLAAMSAAMLALGERIAGELERGDLEQVFVKGERGIVVLMSIGGKAVLTAIADERARLGLVVLEMRRALEDLRLLI